MVGRVNAGYDAEKKQLIRMNGGFTEVEVPPENPRGEVVEG